MAETGDEIRKYRSDTEILYEILRVIVSAGERGIKKTHLMYKTNLNSKMLSRYLEILKASNAIEEIKFGKQKIVRLSPLGKTAYASLKTLVSILFPPTPPQELEFIKAELLKLGKAGWNIRFDRIVTGKSGADHKPDAVMTKEDKRYLIGIFMGSTSMEARILLLNFMVSVLDTRSRGIVITDNEEIMNVVPEKIKEDVIVIPSRPLDTLVDRILDAIEK